MEGKKREEEKEKEKMGSEVKEENGTEKGGGDKEIGNGRRGCIWKR